MVGTERRHGKRVHAGLVQRLFLAAALHSSFCLESCNTAGFAFLVYVRYYVCRAGLLRGLREPRVPPEPLAILEEQDGCDRDQYCRPMVLGRSFIEIRTKRRHCEGDESQ
jgi:hypothetical protein